MSKLISKMINLKTHYFMKNRRLGIKDSNKGYIALIAVLTVIVVGSTIATSLILLGLGFSRSTFTLGQSNRAKAAASACAEEALQEIKNSPSFSGSGNLNIGEGTCDYTVEQLGGNNRLITSSGNVGTVVRKVKITLDQVNPINITSWQEVANF